MPQIRFPKTGEGLVRYITIATTAPQDAIFETGAHLLTFAAAMGFHKKEKDKLFEPIRDRPQPIDLNVFKSQGLYETLQLMALAETSSHAIVDQEKELCDLVEQYASAGFKHLQAMHNECDGAFFYRQLFQQIEAALPAKHTRVANH